MKQVRKERTVTIINPIAKGCRLISTKNGRNNPCQCGSGKKQKHCCGTDFQIRSSIPKETINTEPEPINTEPQTNNTPCLQKSEITSPAETGESTSK